MELVLDQPTVAHGIESERIQRHAIISALYTKRLTHPGKPQISLPEFEQILGVPKEEFEFSLWYLCEGQFAKRTDNGYHSITMKGVDLAETGPAVL